MECLLPSLAGQEDEGLVLALFEVGRAPHPRLGGPALLVLLAHVIALDIGLGLALGLVSFRRESSATRPSGSISAASMPVGTS